MIALQAAAVAVARRIAGRILGPRIGHILGLGVAYALPSGLVVVGVELARFSRITYGSGASLPAALRDLADRLDVLAAAGVAPIPAVAK